MKNSIRSVIIIAGLLVSYDEVSHILLSFHEPLNEWNNEGNNNSIK